jgi:hypothetical protein
MEHESMDLNRSLMLDGNAVAALFHDIFGDEMTTAPAECANCGNVAELGALLAFTQSPGTVLRCPVCEQVVMRIVQTRHAIYFDARGAAYVRMWKRAA